MKCSIMSIMTVILIIMIIIFHDFFPFVVDSFMSNQIIHIPLTQCSPFSPLPWYQLDIFYCWTWYQFKVLYCWTRYQFQLFYCWTWYQFQVFYCWTWYQFHIFYCWTWYKFQVFYCWTWYQFQVFYFWTWYQFQVFYCWTWYQFQVFYCWAHFTVYTDLIMRWCSSHLHQVICYPNQVREDCQNKKNHWELHKHYGSSILAISHSVNCHSTATLGHFHTFRSTKSRYTPHMPSTCFNHQQYSSHMTHLLFPCV